MIQKTSFGNWYYKSILKYIPEYAFLSLIACVVLNSVVYWGTQHLMIGAYHYDFTSVLDNQIPFIKEWIVIYILSYAFWIINFVMVSRENKETWFRFATADIMSKLICAVFFIIIPTTNIRPQVPGTDIFSDLVRLIYRADLPANLFPSIHCLVSWLCFIGIRKSEKIPLWYKIFSCLFAILICASTQFTKQHYLADVAGGILIAELCYRTANHTRIYLPVQDYFDRAEQRLFGGEKL